MNNSAFIGVSLDSGLFTREWIRNAIHHLLSRHETILLVLADQLLAYNKIANFDAGRATFDLQSAKVRIDQRRNDIMKFVQKEVALLPNPDKARVRIATWADFSDGEYCRLLREIRIAYSTIREFRSCVDSDASCHFDKRSQHVYSRDAHHELSVSYVLDETAMDIRITELGGFQFEYYPDKHIQTLTRLYDEQFADYGLTVSNLVGHNVTRVFRPLYCDCGEESRGTR